MISTRYMRLVEHQVSVVEYFAVTYTSDELIEIMKIYWDQLQDAVLARNPDDAVYYRVLESNLRGISAAALAWVSHHSVSADRSTPAQLAAYAIDLHQRKNAGYAGADNPDPWANFRESTGVGVSSLQGVLVRMSDKWIRVRNLLRRPQDEQVGETIMDTMFDLSAYALIALCLMIEAESGVSEYEVYGTW